MYFEFASSISTLKSPKPKFSHYIPKLSKEFLKAVKCFSDLLGLWEQFISILVFCKLNSIKRPSMGLCSEAITLEGIYSLTY